MKRILLYSTMMLMACFDAAAQQPAMTLKECLEKGLENNYALRIVRGREQMADNSASWGNSGMLPTLSASAGYGASFDNDDATARNNGGTTSQRNITNQTLHAGVDLNWTVFDGLKMHVNDKRLRELHLQSQTQTRVAIEDYVAALTSEYFNFVHQRLRMQNLNYALTLSRERVRIVHERYIIGDNSRLDLLQARVDLNADSAQVVKQREMLASSRIKLHELMSDTVIDLSKKFAVADTAINVGISTSFEALWEATKQNNAELLVAAQDKRLAELDLRSMQSRNYPYLKVNAGYGYTHNRFEEGVIERRDKWGANVGATVGINIFDGKRHIEQRNSKIAIENATLKQQDLELKLYADLTTLWQAYQNNMRLLTLERQNVIAARENYSIAHERYLLGNLSGIEMREAQMSLRDAEERILIAEYNTKLCEISLMQLSGNIMEYVI